MLIKETKQQLTTLTNELIAFSKLERIIASICMGIPFLLILADCEARITFWPIFFAIVIIMSIPLIVSLAASYIKKQDKFSKGIIAFVGLCGFLALLFYLLYLTLPGCGIRNSISSYVAMENAHVFGLLLTIASMLFIFNGAVYINKVSAVSKKKHGKWYNIILGIFLLGVVLLPCTNKDLYGYHIGCAIVFFFGSAVVIAIFNDKEHRKISMFIAGFTVMSFAIYLLNSHVLHNPVLDLFTLFWAETISLWVIGIHYILESLGDLT